MKQKDLNPGDLVELKTSEKEWKGTVLESHDPETVLLKLESGYNIGVKEEKVLNVRVIKKAVATEKETFKTTRNPDLPKVAMIITGGTISSRLDSKTGGVKWTTVADLFNIAPELNDICNIVKIEEPFMKGSEDMSLKFWKIIAEKAAELLNDENIDGLIVTHGTDTLHFGSAALSFFLGKLNKPVAFTYSQRSIDRGSTDAHLNLICAARFAVSDIAEVAVVGHENLDDKTCLAIPGTKVRKLHSSRRDAFKPVNTEPFARIDKENLEILRDFNPRNTGKVKSDTSTTSKVGFIKVHPGQSPKVLDFYASEGYKGLVLETTGLGQVPGPDSENDWLPTIKRLVSDGMIICATAQTIYGGLNPNVYSTGRALQKTGIIFLKDMLSETAFVKLSWVLGHKSMNTPEKIRERMLENVSGEFNDKIGFDGK